MWNVFHILSFIHHSLIPPLSFKGALGQTLRDEGVEQSTVGSVITAHTQGPEGGQRRGHDVSAKSCGLGQVLEKEKGIAPTQ